MEYPNSSFLREGLLKSGWSEASASVESFIVDEAKLQAEVEMLRKQMVPEDTIRDKAVFRLLNPPVKSDIPRSSNQAFEAQHRQILDRTRQQREHEARLLAEVTKFRKSQDAQTATIADLRLHAATIADIDSVIDKNHADKLGVLEVLRSANVSLTQQIAGVEEAVYTAKAESAAIKETQFNLVAEAKWSRKEAWIRFAITTALLVGLILLSAIRGYSQQANVNPTITIPTCAGITVTAGARTALTTDTTGQLCVSIVGAVTLGGQPIQVTGSTNGTPVTVTFASSSVTVNNNNTSVLVGGQPIAVTGSTSGTPVTISFQTANLAVNLAQVAGATVLTGSGTSAGAQRVVIATPDPCFQGYTANGLPYSISITTSTQVITGVTGQHVYICGFAILPIGTATNVAMVYGTGTVCATSIAGGPTGGTTAATGANIAANGGFVMGFAGRRIGRTESTGDNVCLLLSAANQVSGTIDYVISP